LAFAGPLPITASAIGYGASFLAVPAAVTALIRAAIPPSEWIGALTAFTIVFAAGQTGGPYLAGTLADRYGTGATLAWTTAVCVHRSRAGPRHPLGRSPNGPMTRRPEPVPLTRLGRIAHHREHGRIAK
jgi:uncharacterized MFS-type transporter YbfB